MNSIMILVCCKLEQIPSAITFEPRRVMSSNQNHYIGYSLCYHIYEAQLLS